MERPKEPDLSARDEVGVVAFGHDLRHGKRRPGRRPHSATGPAPVPCPKTGESKKKEDRPADKEQEGSASPVAKRRRRHPRAGPAHEERSAPARLGRTSRVRAGWNLPMRAGTSRVPREIADEERARALAGRVEGAIGGRQTAEANRRCPREIVGRDSRSIFSSERTVAAARGIPGAYPPPEGCRVVWRHPRGNGE